MKKQKGMSLIAFTLIVVLLIGLALATYYYVIPALTTKKVSINEAKSNEMLSNKDNSIVYDCYGNKIYIPAGFKILFDKTTGYNEETLSVTKGVVIEDEKGNQFVWIPVGKIYTNKEKTEYKEIKFSRYTFKDDGTPVNVGSSKIEQTNVAAKVYYKEDSTSKYGNCCAKDLAGFKRSVTSKGGYYIARYEARKGNNGEVVANKNYKVYNHVTQIKASNLSREMYGENNKFTTDLMNSFAWDTALVFLQTFDNRKDKTTPYSKQYSINDSFNSKGTNKDIICNIYDMGSNCREYTTEYFTYDDMPCVTRGSCYGARAKGIGASWRCKTKVDPGNILYDQISFRPILYI